MKKLIVFSMLLICLVIVYSANAFVLGENRIGNGFFETDKVGEIPKGWTFISGG